MAKDEIEVSEPVFDSDFADAGSEYDNLSAEWFMNALVSGVFDTMFGPPVCAPPEENIEEALQKDHEAYIKALESGAFDWMMDDIS